MRTVMIAGALFALAGATASFAQNVIYWPAPTATRDAGPVEFRYFPMGTPLMLRTTTQISTKDNKPGDRIYLEVAEAVTYQGQTVVPVGAPVVGEVVRSDRNGHFGKKGKLDIRLLHMQTPYGPVRIGGHGYDEGKSGTAASVATIVLVSPLGFLIHGTSASIPFGTTIQAYLAEPLRFSREPVQIPLATVQPDDGKSPLAAFTPAPTSSGNPAAGPSWSW